MRDWLRGMFLVGLIVIAAVAVLVAGGLTRSESEQTRRLREAAEQVR